MEGVEIQKVKALFCSQVPDFCFKPIGGLRCLMLETCSFPVLLPQALLLLALHMAIEIFCLDYWEGCFINHEYRDPAF